ncbi:protein phosphatase 1 regulatory subunit 35 [Arapaima gigas]
MQRLGQGVVVVVVVVDVKLSLVSSRWSRVSSPPRPHGAQRSGSSCTLTCFQVGAEFTMSGVLHTLLCGDPDSQALPQPPPAPLGYNSPVISPNLDLSLTLTPERPGREAGVLLRAGRGKAGCGQRHGTHNKVRFDVSGGKLTRTSGEKPEMVTERKNLAGQTQTQTTPTVLVGKKSSKTQEGLIQATDPEQPEALGEEAVLNTTLALKAELLDLASKQFEPKKAVQQQLKGSTHTRNHITVRATEGVLNIPRSQQLYQALISVSVSEDQLVSQALHDRLMLVPTSCSHGNKEPPPEGPNLLAFYSPVELLRETPFLPGDELKLPQLRPVPRPSQATFDLYHKQRQWEA